MKRLAAVVFSFILLVSLIGCSKSKSLATVNGKEKAKEALAPSKPSEANSSKLDKPELGNTYFNLLNGKGFVVLGDNYIYGTVFNDGKIHKISLNGDDLGPISEGIYYNNLNYSNGWIYCIGGEDGNIYKIKTNGQKEIKLSKLASGIDYLILYGDKLYFDEGDLHDNTKINIYRIDLDGKNKTMLFSTYFSPIYGNHPFQIKDDWIYFIDSQKSNYLFRCKTDGSKKQVFVMKSFNHGAFIDGDYLYYAKDVNEYGEYVICRMNLKTKVESKLTEKINSMGNINITYKYIFYSEIYENRVCRINKDGTNKKVIISKIKIDDINIADNFVFCRGLVSPMSFYKTNIDGKGGVVELTNFY